MLNTKEVEKAGQKKNFPKIAELCKIIRHTYKTK